jgi:hypothetical protein
MTTVSWFYDKSAPLTTIPMATQTTYFGTSSLASRAKNALTVEKPGPSGVYQNLLATEGVPNTNITIYATDKSSLGVEVARMALNHKITPEHPRVRELKDTPPNEMSLRRDTLLKTR